MAAAFSALAVSAIATPSRADVVFAATGTFTDGSVLGGTLTINTTAGVITGSNVSVTGASNFTFVNVVNQSNTQVPGDINVGDRNASSTEDFNFDLPGTTLVGYAGGRFCSNSALCLNGTRNADLFNLVTNMGGPTLISGALTAVPEPASVGLLAIGLVGLARRRARMPTP